MMYLNDGPYTFQVASCVTRVPFKHELFEEFVLIGIAYAADEDPADSRARGLTPTADVRRRGSGGARAYLDFLKREVIPFVEKNWRVDPAAVAPLPGASIARAGSGWRLSRDHVCRRLAVGDAEPLHAVSMTDMTIALAARCREKIRQRERPRSR